MRNDLTDITVVMDRSGSMSSCQAEAEGGLNQFIKDQQALPNEALFTLVQFDTVYEVVHAGIPIKQVPTCQLQPRGMTALHDAIGKAIVSTGERLAAMPEADRPGLVIFVILTDGANNASEEWTAARVKTLITQQEQDYNWQFTFLGAGLEACAQGKALGIKSTFQNSPENYKQAYNAASRKTSDLRTARASDISLSAVPDITEEEQKKMA